MSRWMFLTILSFLFACNATPPQIKQHKDTIPSFPFNAISPKEKAYYASMLAPLYNTILVQKGFNGSILLAKNGEIVFEDYHGFINFKTKDSITPTTPFHLASISKTFTAMVILHLMEQGKLQLNDKVSNYLPSFPYQNVTIKNLLSHRSGLPNYVHFMQQQSNVEIIRIKNKHGRTIRRKRILHEPTAAPFKGLATNEDVLNYMIKNHIKPEAAPDRVFNYCNTNYALLALIAEKITGIAFPQYMKDSVFTPLGMVNSFVFSVADTGRYVPSYQYNGRPFLLEHLDCVYGDKNVYSTVRDMLLWDKALYSGSLVSCNTLCMAYTPFSNERKSMHNYGLGWRLLVRPTDTVVYHNGWWHGNNTVFTRLIKDTATLIILGNKFNRNIYSAKQLSAVLTGRIDTAKLED